MPNQIRGKILQIEATQSFTTKSGNDFSKREFVLDCTTYDTYTGEPRPNYPSFTLMSKHVTDIDAYKAGDDVLVSFFISGRPWEKDGVKRYINEVVAYKIESFVQQSAQPTAQPPFPPNVDANGTTVENTEDMPF